ncbi:MAG: DNA starvation/stationary phase protection protein [Nitrospira sp.]|nr:MAG: DNA starvation/stationary phase protection protein [Nitrospira sp.]
MKPNIGISDGDRQAVSRILAAIQADEVVLSAKTRQYHWNVMGPHFSELHRLFEEQYDAIEETSDELAERERALGAIAPGTLAAFLAMTRLQEQQTVPNAQGMVTNLLQDHETIIRQLRADIEATGATYRDVGTSDFLTGIMEAHEKMAWMLRAHAEA